MKSSISCFNAERKKAISLNLLLFIAFSVVYYPVIIKLVKAWSHSEEYSHGFIILPLCLYIIWKKKDELKKIEIIPHWSGLIVVLLSLALYLVSYHAQIVTVSSFSMILFIMGYVLYVYGINIFNKLMFPLFFLLFMIPVPSQIFAQLTIPLQLIVSKVSVFLASALGATIYREGNVIHLPEIKLQVVQACSGLRSIISLLTLCTVWGYMALKSNVLRTILIMSGLPFAILINIMRVFLMITAFYYFKMDLAHGAIHTYFGMFIFLIALIIIYLFQGALTKWDK